MNSNTGAHGRPPLGGSQLLMGPLMCSEEGNQGSQPFLQVFTTGFVVGAAQLPY